MPTATLVTFSIGAVFYCIAWIYIRRLIHDVNSDPAAPHTSMWRWWPKGWRIHQDRFPNSPVRTRVFISIALSVAFGLSAFVSDVVAKFSSQSEPLAINVVLPPHGIAFRNVGHRLLRYSAGRPVLSGRPIVVNEIYVRPEELQQFISRYSSIDIIVCDSPEQLENTATLRAQATALANACGSEGNCPALIPKSVSSARRDAVQQVFGAITAP